MMHVPMTDSHIGIFGPVTCLGMPGSNSNVWDSRFLMVYMS